MLTKMRMLSVLAVFVFAAGGYLYSVSFRPIVFALIDRQVEKIAEATTVDDDAFQLLFCGTGSPNRTPHRGQPCTALVAAGKLFLFDAGEGSIAKLAEYEAPLGRLHTIFLTHLHSDHVSGVAEVMHNSWLYGRRHELAVVGPPGTARMVAGFEAAYSDDLDERTRVLGIEAISPALAFSGARDEEVGGDEIRTFYDAEGLVIKAFQIDHPDWPHAYGYRIEHKGKVIVISGDTRASESIVTHARGADLLVHEALNMEAMTHIGAAMDRTGGPIPGSRMARIAEVHTTTHELADLAERAEVKALAITHLIPAIPPNWVADQFFVDGMSVRYGGPIMIARDGDWLDLSD